MAKRPLYLPKFDGAPYVESRLIEFRWYPGFSTLQAQKSIRSLHRAAEEQGFFPILEISGKSKSLLGKSLSAFNLTLETPDGHSLSVECAFQGSKVFEGGGPYYDLYSVSSREAKTDKRLRNSGEVVAFDYFGREFPNEPQTAFYDWLYMTALRQMEPSPIQELRRFDGFSDIAFNPRRSINCQARAAAMFVALSRCVAKFAQFLDNWDTYIRTVSGTKRQSLAEQTSRQLDLPLGSTCDSNAPPAA